MGRIAKLLSFIRTIKNNAKVSDVKVDPGGGPNITAEHFSAPGDDSHPLPGDYVALNTRGGTGREDAIGYADPLNEPKALTGDKRIYARSPTDDGAKRVIAEQWLKNDGTIVTNCYKLDGQDIKLVSTIEQTPAGEISHKIFDGVTTKVSTIIKVDGTAITENENGSVLLRADGGVITTTPESIFDAKADGSIKGANSAGDFELQAGGDFLVNGVTIDTSGNITSPTTITAVNVVGSTSVKADGKELAGHSHPAGTLLDSVPAAVTGATGANS